MRDLPGCWCGEEMLFGDDWFIPYGEPIGEWDVVALKALVDEIFGGEENEVFSNEN